MKLVVLMMLKNESLRIRTTLNTIKGCASGLIIFDTGSSDDTIEICKKWCEENSLDFHCKQGEFVDFSKSRNDLLDFADSIEGYDFQLSLDCNDEVRGGDQLLKDCERFMTLPHKVFMVNQHWLCGTSVTKYSNSRLTKSRCGWRYKKRVHEVLMPPSMQKPGDVATPDDARLNCSDEVVLYQNRNEDDDKTLRRFKRDKIFLQEDVEKEGDSRDMFYLAQTLACLGEYENAFDMYQRRGDIITGFWEERFHSFLRSGEIKLAHCNDRDEAIPQFFKASMIDCRAESLTMLSKMFKDQNDFITSYMFSRAACDLVYPKHNILFVSLVDYEYERWQNHSVICFYTGRYTEGLKALDIAKKYGKDPQLNEQNTEQYEKKKGLPDTKLFPAENEPLIGDLADIYEGYIKSAQQALNDKKLDESIISFFKAWQTSRLITPLLMLAEYCRMTNAFNLSYYILKFVCECDIPNYINKDAIKDKKVKTKYGNLIKDYYYIRWHLMGIIGYHSNHHFEGKSACLIALKEGLNIPLDRNNLNAYLEAEKKEKEIPDVPKQEPVLSKPEDTEKQKEFIDRRVQELMGSNPKIDKRQAQMKAKLEWKLKEK